MENIWDKKTILDKWRLLSVFQVGNFYIIITVVVVCRHFIVCLLSRIDWEFKSPEGKVYNDLKKVMSLVKQKASRYEKWEVYRSKKTSGIDAGSGHYVTLKQQFEDELDLALDTDVFAVRLVDF